MGLSFKKDLRTTNRTIVMAKLCDHADDEGRDVYPGLAKIAAQTHLHRRTVQRVLNDLIADGLVVVVKEAAGPGHAAEYRIDVDRLLALPEVQEKGRRTATHSQKGGAVPPNQRAADNHPKGWPSVPKGWPSVPKGWPTTTPTNITANNRQNISSDKSFEEFRRTFPDRAGGHAWAKAQAEHARIVRTGGVTPEDLAGAAANYAHECAELNTPRQFVKSAERFLSERTFEDYVKGRPDDRRAELEAKRYDH